MSETVGRPDWLTAPQTAAVMDALERAGGTDCARFVGGCVRNAVLGEPVGDLDIATLLPPEAVIAALKAARLKAIPTGVEHGTVTALSEGRTYEITTLRRDIETDGRRAVVAFTTDWVEDAGRRDFTLNALYATRDGVVLDPLGRGLEDARAGRIVFVGEAQARIREDYLRILRFFRFLAWYGRGGPDSAAVAACAALKGGISTLAAERVSAEILKLLNAADPRAAVALMDETGVLGAALPEVGDRSRFDALVRQETELLFAGDALLRLAALLSPDVEAARAAATRLRLSNAQRDRVSAAQGTTPPLAAAMTPRDVRRAVYLLGAKVFADRARLAWAAETDTAATPDWRAILAQAASWTAPMFPVGGEAAAAAGLPRGPKLGQVLRALEAWWVDADFPDDTAALQARLTELAAAAK